MKYRAIILAALALAGTQAFGAQIVYGGVLLGSNEVPANASPGIGDALVTVDTVANTMRVQVIFSGLLGTTTASHIHFGSGPGTNGAVATTTPTFSGFPLGVTSGSYDNTLDMLAQNSYNNPFWTGNGASGPTAFAAFQNNLAAGFGYLNVHSTVFPGGELRANLAAVPEPASMTALALGLGAIAARRRKK